MLQGKGSQKLEVWRVLQSQTYCGGVTLPIGSDHSQAYLSVHAANNSVRLQTLI